MGLPCSLLHLSWAAHCFNRQLRQTAAVTPTPGKAILPNLRLSPLMVRNKWIFHRGRKKKSQVVCKERNNLLWPSSLFVLVSEVTEKQCFVLWTVLFTVSAPQRILYISHNWIIRSFYLPMDHKFNTDFKWSILDPFKRSEGESKPRFPQYIVIHNQNNIQRQQKNKTRWGVFASVCVSPPKLQRNELDTVCD